MQDTLEQQTPAFTDRRQGVSRENYGGVERRQFTDSRKSFRPEVVELAEAVDEYKVRHRRRFLTYDELFDLIAQLGYVKPESQNS